MWKTAGWMPMAKSACTPPTPSTISLLYPHLVITAIELRGDCAVVSEFLGKVGIVQVRVIRPTCSCQIFEATLRPGRATCTVSGLPLLSSASRIGRCEKFWFSWTLSCCPSLLICWRK
jgi:hypothetical protein